MCAHTPKTLRYLLSFRFAFVLYVQIEREKQGRSGDQGDTSDTGPLRMLDDNGAVARVQRAEESGPGARPGIQGIRNLKWYC